MEGDEAVTELVLGAAAGDREAWEALVRRFTPLLMSVVRGYRLPEDEVRDIAQTVWLRLVEHLAALREPRALPGWLITTARNEALRLLKARTRTLPVAVVFDSEEHTSEKGSIDEDLLRIERREALLEAFAELGDRDRQLLALLVADPPVAYAEISRRLHIPIGSIGPTRARVLAKLRACPSLVALDQDMSVTIERR